METPLEAVDMPRWLAPSRTLPATRHQAPIAPAEARPAHRHDCVLSIERDGRVLRRRSAALFCLLKSMAIIKALVNRQSPELQKLALQFTKYHASVDSPTQAESRVMQGRIRDRMSGRLGAVMAGGFKQADEDRHRQSGGQG